MKTYQRLRGGATLLAAFVLVGVLVFSLASCAEESSEAAQVVIYGSDQCSICVALRGELDRADVPYRFHDILADDEAYAEIVALAQGESWWEGRVTTPTLWIRGDLYVRPSFDEVMTALGQ